MSTMDAKQVQNLIRRAKGNRPIRDLAAEWGVDHSYLHRMMTGDREPSDEVLKILQLYRVVSYQTRKSK